MEAKHYLGDEATRRCFTPSPRHLVTSWSVDRLEVGDNLGSPRFEEWRQHDLLAQCGFVLVHREPWPIRGDLEQDAIWLAEVQAAEPVAIDLAAVGDAQSVQSLGPGIVLLKGRRPQGD